MRQPPIHFYVGQYIPEMNATIVDGHDTNVATRYLDILVVEHAECGHVREYGHRQLRDRVRKVCRNEMVHPHLCGPCGRSHFRGAEPEPEQDPAVVQSNFTAGPTWRPPEGVEYPLFYAGPHGDCSRHVRV
jgi:hypothetical protein